jgi:hypothetical protein
VIENAVGPVSTLSLVRGAGHEMERLREALDAVRQRYSRLRQADKWRLLDELELLTGYHRKSLLRLLNQRPSAEQAARFDGVDDPILREPHPRRRYGPEAAATLVPLWEASDWLCGKRLKALLPLLVAPLEHHGHLSLEPVVREKVLAMSSATMDRLLAPIRKATGSNNWPWPSDRADPFARVPEQGPGLDRTEERDAYASCLGVSAVGGS